MKYSKKEIDQLSSAMIVFMHSAELCMKQIMYAYESIHAESKEYVALCKKFGKVQARMILQKTVNDILTHSRKALFSRWIEQAKKLEALTDQVTEAGITTHEEGYDAGTIFDSLTEDANWMVRLYLLNGNINPNDYIRVESTMKLMADKKHTPVSTDMINQFRLK